MNFSHDQFEKTKQEAEEFYKTIGSVHCPYFNEKVNFNTKGFERVKVDDKWIIAMKGVTHYEFIAVVESHQSLIRLKVVIKQVDGGEKFFLSVIPFWKTNKITGERVLGDEVSDEEIVLPQKLPA